MASYREQEQSEHRAIPPSRALTSRKQASLGNQQVRNRIRTSGVEPSVFTPNRLPEDAGATEFETCCNSSEIKCVQAGTYNQRLLWGSACYITVTGTTCVCAIKQELGQKLSKFQMPYSHEKKKKNKSQFRILNKGNSIPCPVSTDVDASYFHTDNS